MSKDYNSMQWGKGFMNYTRDSFFVKVLFQCTRSFTAWSINVIWRLMLHDWQNLRFQIITTIVGKLYEV
jgi:hypothetical protein